MYVVKILKLIAEIFLLVFNADFRKQIPFNSECSWFCCRLQCDTPATSILCPILFTSSES